MGKLKMNTSREVIMKISKVAKRAVEINPDLSHLDTMMDLKACHLNDIPLDFDLMLSANESNLMHDVYGINRHLNRDTGKLMDCFLPRLKSRNL